MGERTRTTVIAVVTAVWAVNFAAGLFPPLSYKPDQAIHGIFMTIVGGLFALGAAKKGDPGSGTGGAHAAPPAPAPEPGPVTGPVPPLPATPAPEVPPPPAEPVPDAVAAAEVPPPPAEPVIVVDPPERAGGLASP